MMADTMTLRLVHADRDEVAEFPRMQQHVMAHMHERKNEHSTHVISEKADYVIDLHGFERERDDLVGDITFHNVHEKKTVLVRGVHVKATPVY